MLTDKDLIVSSTSAPRQSTTATGRTRQGRGERFQRYGVNRRTVQRWFALGLDSFFLGTVRYTSEEAIDRFARWHEQTVAAQAVKKERDRVADERNQLAIERLREMGIKVGPGKEVTDGDTPQEV